MGSWFLLSEGWPPIIMNGDALPVSVVVVAWRETVGYTLSFLLTLPLWYPSLLFLSEIRKVLIRLLKPLLLFDLDLDLLRSLELLCGDGYLTGFGSGFSLSYELDLDRLIHRILSCSSGIVSWLKFDKSYPSIGRLLTLGTVWSRPD